MQEVIDAGVQDVVDASTGVDAVRQQGREAEGDRSRSSSQNAVARPSETSHEVIAR